jgi:hypothetical protein
MCHCFGTSTTEENTMISDVLCEAIAAIQQYQRDMPDVYDDEKERIDGLIAQMEQVLIYFDTPPPARQ